MLNVLPGLREIRGPLASGYLWLIAVWLMVGDRVPDRAEATGVYADLYRLSDAVSEIGVAVALSFVAYLVGSLTEGIFDLGGKAESRWWVSSRARSSLESTVYQRLAKLLRRLWAIEHLRGRAVFDDVENALKTPNDVVQDVYRDLDILASRLLVDTEALYQEYDRARAEAEVRLGVVPPLVVMIPMFATMSAWWLLAAVPVGLLLLQGVRARRRSYSVLADAVLLGVVVPPAVERIERMVEEAEEVAVRRSA